jgi:hypothetical protein
MQAIKPVYFNEEIMTKARAQLPPFFTFSPNEDGRPIVLEAKAVAYLEDDADELYGYILASSQDVREMLERLALYLQASLRLKGCAKAERLADEAFGLLSRSLKNGGQRAITSPLLPYTVLLLYPPSMTDGNLETYFTHVEAAGPIEAVKAAREMATAAQEPSARYDPDDFTPLICIARHHEAELLHRDL